MGRDSNQASTFWFTSRRPERQTPPKTYIHIGDTTIKPANEAKYLGVLFDWKLSFQQHIQHAAEKGAQFALAISRIANCTWGPAYQQTRTLFTSVAAPRMEYPAIVWHKPLPRQHPPTDRNCKDRNGAQDGNESNPWYILHHRDFCTTDRDILTAYHSAPQKLSSTILDEDANISRNSSH